MRAVTIGMAEMGIIKPPQSIITFGLGSCVGLVLYDKITKISGMVHIVLPNYNKNLNGVNVAKCADTAVIALHKKMLEAGARRGSIVAKMAGGAHMFSTSANSKIFQVGQRNVEVTTQMLNNLRIPIVAKDVFGDKGRTVEFFAETGMLRIKTVGKGETSI